MKPASGTYLLFLEDQGVLFHEPAQKLFHLNTTAAFIWCLLEDGKDDLEIVSDLQSTFAISESEASGYLRQTELLLQSLAVIEGFEQEVVSDIDSTPVSRSGESEQAHESIDCENYHFVKTSQYRLLSSHIQMRFSNHGQSSWIEPILGHLKDDSAEEPTVSIDIIEDQNGKKVLYRDGVQVLSCTENNRLGPLAKSLVWQTAVNNHRYFLDIHAAVVGDGECCFLFPAAPGSGKSTLTAFLVHHGFEFFSDEVALLHEADLDVCPVPLATCVKESGVDVLSRIYPQLLELTPHLRGDGKWVRYLPPPSQVVPPPETYRHVGAIVFPQYDPDKPTALENISTMEALRALMQECLIVNTRLDLEKVSALLNWMDKTPCYRLFVSDLNDAKAAIQSLSSSVHSSSL